MVIRFTNSWISYEQRFEREKQPGGFFLPPHVHVEVRLNSAGANNIKNTFEVPWYKRLPIGPPTAAVT